jgi:hypothetical protein
MAAAFLIQTPTGKKEYEGGGLNLDNVTEELLNGFFCHYEPPTSENAQFKAARAARADPTKYSHRPVAKPILRTPTLHPKNRKNKGGGSRFGSKSDAATAGASTHTPSGKSVTWRDEQTNKDRNKVEKEVVGCAVNYCGIFQQGEGLTDELMSPAEKAAAAKAKAAKASLKKKTAGSDSSVGTPTSAASTVQTSSNESTGSGSSKKRLTPILTNRSKKNKTDTPSPTADASLPSRRILYDDLGNPITEGEEDDYTFGPDESILGTPRTPATMADTPRTQSDSGVDTGLDTPTAEKTGAETTDSNNPLAFLLTMPTAMIGAATMAAASAAEAVGFKPSPNPKQTEASETPDSAATTASPSILRRPAPSDTNSGVVAEYRDEMGVYEPLDYNNPFPNAIRDPHSGLAYKRVRSPPIRRRQPTPRRVRGMSERYEDELYEDDYYGQRMMGDGVAVSSLGKIPRQSTGTFDTAVARQSPRDAAPRVYRGHDLSPSTITGATSYQYEQDASGRRLRPEKSPGRRSDIYSDLTMEEEAYIYYRSPSHMAAKHYQKDEFEVCEKDRQPRRMSQEEIVEEEARLYYEQERAAMKDRRSRGSDQYRSMIAYGDDDEEQLSPRHYAERFRKQRSGDHCDPKRRIETEEMGEDDNDLVENLSPRQYAEKYRELRAAEMEGRNEEGSSGSGSKKERDSISKTKTKKQERKQNTNQEAGAYTKVGQRDPTPRNSVDPLEVGHNEQKGPLPPTPRRETDNAEKNPRRQEFSSTPESHDTFDFSKKSLCKRENGPSELPMNQFSPRSMATDDEIREEVSSVGMASETIRPLYYANPFLSVPPAVIEDEEQNLPLEQDLPKEAIALEPSTLSGSGSTLSSKPSTKHSGRSSQKQQPRSRGKALPAIQNSSSGSTRSKKLWRGWKSTVGKVKKIVQDIDEQRIHPPHFSPPRM